MNVASVTVSLHGMDRGWPEFWGVEIRGRRFKRAADVQRTWFDAVMLVDTPYFFFIDDDDDLPPNYVEIVDRCIAADVAVAYTDELVDGVNRRRRDVYSQAAHLRDPALLHHLVLCRTDVAREAIASLPEGDYWPEMMLYWQMAKLAGAAYVPEIGYHWNRRPDGLHRWWWTVRGIHNSVMWCKENP